MEWGPTTEVFQVLQWAESVGDELHNSRVDCVEVGVSGGCGQKIAGASVGGGGRGGRRGRGAGPPGDLS